MSLSFLFASAQDLSDDLASNLEEDSQNIISYSEKASEFVIEYLPKLVFAILFLILAFWLIKKATNFLSNLLIKAGMDVSVTKFLASVISVFIKFVILLSAAGMVGIKTTAFVTIFGALMVGVGMAFNGNIAHFVSGVMIMLTKPFKIGDLVTISDAQTGTVTAISAFNTTLITLANKKVVVANSNVTNKTITNISGQETVGVELTFPIGYKDDIDKARAIILEVSKNCPFILDDPKQAVVVGNWNDASIDLATRPFCKSEHYYDVAFYLNEEVKQAFDKQLIGIPYPTMDLNIVNVKNALSE